MWKFTVVLCVCAEYKSLLKLITIVKVFMEAYLVTLYFKVSLLQCNCTE